MNTHRKRNRAPRLPSNSQLLAARQRQTSATADGEQVTSSTTRVGARAHETPATETADADITDASKPVGPATEGAEPWQLQYYDPSTRDIIERAKRFSHCDAASINAFPLRPVFTDKAIEYIDEAVAERRARRLHVSEGKEYSSLIQVDFNRPLQVGGRIMHLALRD